MSSLFFPISLGFTHENSFRHQHHAHHRLSTVWKVNPMGRLQIHHVSSFRNI